MSGTVTIVCINQVIQWFQSMPLIVVVCTGRAPQVCESDKTDILKMRVRVSCKVRTPSDHYMVVPASLLNMSLIELRAPAGCCRHRHGKPY